MSVEECFETGARGNEGRGRGGGGVARLPIRLQQTAGTVGPDQYCVVRTVHSTVFSNSFRPWTRLAYRTVSYGMFVSRFDTSHL